VKAVDDELPAFIPVKQYVAGESRRLMRRIITEGWN